jgi:hypothetical protein
MGDTFCFESLGLAHGVKRLADKNKALAQQAFARALKE